MGLYTQVITTIDSTCETFIQGNVTAIADGIKDPAFTLAAVYVLFWGFSHLLNLVQEPITDSIKRLIKLIFILGIAFNIASYNSYITDTITGVPEELARLFTDSSQSDELVNSLDKIFDDTWEVGAKFWDAAGIVKGNPGYYFIAILIFAVACGLSAYSAFLIILSKIAISVLVALGPLFIISVLFSSTKRYFENWIQMLTNYGLVLVLVIAINKFILDIFRHYLSVTLTDTSMEAASVSPLIITALISVFVLAQVLSIASGLAGGVSLATMGAGRWVGSKIGSAGKLAGRGAIKGAKTATTRARTALSSWNKRGSVTGS